MESGVRRWRMDVAAFEPAVSSAVTVAPRPEEPPPVRPTHGLAAAPVALPPAPPWPAGAPDGRTTGRSPGSRVPGTASIALSSHTSRHAAGRRAVEGEPARQSRPVLRCAQVPKRELASAMCYAAPPLRI